MQKVYLADLSQITQPPPPVDADEELARVLYKMSIWLIDARSLDHLFRRDRIYLTPLSAVEQLIWTTGLDMTYGMEGYIKHRDLRHDRLDNYIPIEVIQQYHAALDLLAFSGVGVLSSQNTALRVLYGVAPGDSSHATSMYILAIWNALGWEPGGIEYAINAIRMEIYENPGFRRISSRSVETRIILEAIEEQEHSISATI